MGTGPFKFVQYTPGSEWVGKRNEDYWDKGKPYLDSYRALFIRDTAAQVAAVKGERAHVEFRGSRRRPATSWSRRWGTRSRSRRAPGSGRSSRRSTPRSRRSTMSRVRKALSLAVDRWRAPRR